MAPSRANLRPTLTKWGGTQSNRGKAERTDILPTRKMAFSVSRQSVTLSVERETRFELATFCLEGRRSARLSYSRVTEASLAVVTLCLPRAVATHLGKVPPTGPSPVGRPPLRALP